MKQDISTPIGRNFKRGKRIDVLTSDKRIYDLLFYDTEAYITKLDDKTESHTVRLIVWRYVKLDDNGAIILSEYGNTQSSDDFINVIKRKNVKNTNLYMICHNASYDVQILSLINLLLETGYKHTKSVLEFPPFIMTLVRGKHRLTLLDNLNFARTSIKELGKSIGIDKLEIDYYDNDNIEKMLIYAYRDVEILSEWFIRYYRFLVDNDLCPFANTLAGQAFRTYRYKFLKRDIPLHRVERVLYIERFTYIGGRVECFRLGKFSLDQYYKLDINSMYPYVMRNRKYPLVYLGMRENVNKDDLYKLVNDYYCIARVTVKTNTPIIPLRTKDLVVYPVGEFETWLHHGELELVMKYALDYKVNEILIYKPDDLFSSYVDYFYHIKVDAELRGDKTTRQMAKLFMNSLYGKFGQVGYEYIYQEAQDNDNKFYRYVGYSERLGKDVVINHLGDKDIVSIKEGESYYSNPAIAGAVTSYARSYLAELMLTAGIENVFYMDTDSLIVNYYGYKALKDYIDEHTLGMLKIEAVENELVINGLKDYVIGNEVKIKGVNKNAIKVSDNVYLNTHFRGAKTWLREGGEAKVIVSKVEKTLKRVYRKGVVCGYDVLPFDASSLPNNPLNLP